MTIHYGNFSDLPPQVRTIVLIGRRTSDHLQELVRMAEFRGRAAYRIEAATELQSRWFVGVESVGIVMGAQGLETVRGEVERRLNQFASSARHDGRQGEAQ